MTSSEQASEALPPGTTLGRYELRRLIGQGGMGCVYEAVHRDLKKRVAIKTLLPMLAANEEARQRFFREGEAASRIRHPHVVDVTDVGAEGNTIYLVMEYLHGEDLSALIAREQGLAIDHAADIMLPVMAAITTAHEQGVVHRDLKPENIFLSTSNYGGMVPKVLDFGISKVLDQVQRMALTGTAVTLGTAFYLPPEHLRGSRQADARGDQYALGAILYECMTGHRAFQGETLYAVLKAVGDGAYPPIRERRPDLPVGLEMIITRALSLEPAARFASVRQMGRALLPFASAGMRAMWTPFFLVGPEPAQVDAADPGPPAGIQPKAITGGTAQMPVATTPMPSVATRTLSRPTLADADSGPSDDGIATVSRSRSRIPVLAGLALVVVVAVIVAAMRGDHPPVTALAPARQPAPAQEPALEPAPQLPPSAPPSGAPPLPAPVAAMPPAAASPPIPTAPPAEIEPAPAAPEPTPAPASPAPAPTAAAPAPEAPAAAIGQRSPTVARPRTGRAAPPSAVVRSPSPAPSPLPLAPPRGERPVTRSGKGRTEPLPNNAPIVD